MLPFMTPLFSFLLAGGVLAPEPLYRRGGA